MIYLVLDGQDRKVPEWYRLLVDEICSSNVTLVHLLPRPESRLEKIQRLWKLFSLRQIVERVSFKSLEKLERWVCRAKIEDGYIDCPEAWHSCYLHVEKFGHYWSLDQEFLTISNEGDKAIYVGTHLLDASILNVFDGDVWSLHHGEIDKFRGGPPGFWEVYYKEPVTGFVIQRLSQGVDDGVVLSRGNCPTSFSWILNQQMVFLKSIPSLVRLLNSHGSREPGNSFCGSSEHKKQGFYNSRVYSVPSVFQQLMYVKYLLGFFLGWFFRKALSIRQNWFVGYLCSSRRSGKVQFVQNPKNGYFADPCLLEVAGETRMFVENYCWKTRKGVIDSFVMESGHFSHEGTVLERDFHLSFPYTFIVENKCYMVPEQHQSRKIVLYESRSMPANWIECATLVNDVSAADPIVFFKDDLWWLLCSIDSSNQSEHCSELFIFYSKDLEVSNWIPHKNNPVIFDSRRARNGGYFVDKGEHYRVFQQHAIENYGRGFGIARIDMLTPETYQEVTVFTSNERWFGGFQGGHSYGITGNLQVFDCYKFCRS